MAKLRKTHWRSKSPLRLVAAAAVVLWITAGAGSAPVASAEGSTRVSGTLSGDVTWDAEGSPYVLSGVVTVARGARLTVSPGVEVRADTGATVVVRGVLRVEGTLRDPVSFRALSPTGRWEGIRFVGTGGLRREDSRSVIAHAELRDASTAVASTYDSPAVRDVVFTKNRRGVVLVMPAADVQIERAQFFRNRVALSGWTASTISVSGSDFYDNNRNVVAGPKRPYACVRDDGVWAVNGNDIVRGPDDKWFSDDIVAARGSYHSGFTIDMRLNYWHALDNGDVEGRIVDAADFEKSWKDGLRARVRWSPLSPTPLTLWTPPGPISEPPMASYDHPDVAMWTYVTSPKDTARVSRRKT